MMSNRRIVEVAGEKAALISERTDSYRSDLVRCLVEVIQTQQEGLSEKGRRDRVSKIIEAFGGKVGAKRGEG